jgi:hypothetical protein
MDQIGAIVLNYLNKQRFTRPTTSRFEAAFRDYARSIIMIDGQSLMSVNQALDRFTQELRYYAERKATNKVQCSLCSSPYEARQQDKSEVLFKPQQYSNKTRLDTSTVVRGICPICALEMMLRQVQQGMRAGSAQDEKPIGEKGAIMSVSPGGGGWGVATPSYHHRSERSTPDQDARSPGEQRATANRWGRGGSDGDCTTQVALAPKPTPIQQPTSLDDVDLMFSAPLMKAGCAKNKQAGLGVR